MLDPGDRTPLLEALRPPEGFRLDYAIATTFSLDLITLLTAPVAFTFHDWEAEGGETDLEPLALLEALTHHAERLAVFCQADRISVPRKVNSLFGFLEDRIFPVRAPSPDGVFHPKVWVLRFTDPADRVRYRLLVSSRNLTFDRSWDTLLVLDGELTDRVKGFATVRPLGEFLGSLTDMCVHRVPRDVVSRVREIAAEIRRVRFELPEGVDEIRFWPMGYDGRPTWPFPESCLRLAVISPFLTTDTANRLGRMTEQPVLVSDTEELDRLDPGTLAPFDVRVLSAAARSGEDSDTGDGDGLASPGLRGLHAKLYIVDQGKHSRLWTGSANATTAAFSHNVEFLVELAGRRKTMGVECLLAERQGEASFASLLETWQPPETREPDEDGEALAFLVESVRRAIGRLTLRLDVQEAGEPDTFSLALTGTRLAAGPSGTDLSVTCRPISLGPGHASVVHPGNKIHAVFPGLTLEAITSFIVFSVTARRKERELGEHFVLNLPLYGAPVGRRQRIIQFLLKDEKAVLRFILLLLAEDEERSIGDVSGSGEGFSIGDWLGEDAVLESLLRALVRGPDRLDRVARLIEDLTSGENAPPLPGEFLRIWEVVWAQRTGEARR